MMNNSLSNVNGLLAILFGIIAIFFPALTLSTLAIFFGATIALGGIALIIFSMQTRRTSDRWVLQFVEGLTGVLLGGLVLLSPRIASSFLMVIIGVWAIFLGFLMLLTYYRLRGSGRSKSITLATSILFLVLGILIAFNPFESSRIITVLIGIHAVFYGVYSFSNS